MAINLGGGSPISADLMYKFYDNKAITPQIRAALQKREDEEAAKSDNSSSSGSSSKFGPSSRVNITDQIIRMNIANNSSNYGQKEEVKEDENKTDSKRPSGFDPLTEVKKAVDEREAEAQKEKDTQLQAIKDKIAEEEKAAEEAKKAEEEAAKAKENEANTAPETPDASETPENP